MSRHSNQRYSRYSSNKSYSSYSGRRKLSRGTSRFLAKLAVITGVTSALAVSVMGFVVAQNSPRDSSPVVALASEAVRSHVAEGVYLNGISIGGLTRQQALERLAELYDANLAELVVVLSAGDDEKLEISFEQLNAGLDFSEAVDYALSLSGAANVTHPATYSFDESGVLPIIEAFLADLTRQPQNAQSERVDGSFSVTEEVVGRSPDSVATIEAFRAQLRTGEAGIVDVVFRELRPAVTAEELRSSQSIIGTFTTNISGSMDNPRNVNVINAARHINGIVVQPGEVFSTNQNFGEMSYANGYRYAPIILNGQFVDGIGGGVCQISSTLYMALLFAEMEIVERRNHSLRVGYIDWAMDATLAGTWIDLRWRNNTDYPVTVEALVRDGQVVINIFGNETRSEGRSLSFTPVHIENIPYSETIIEDPDLLYGERVVESRGTIGQRWALYKNVSENGVQVDRYRVNTSTYRTVDAVVRIGTGGLVEEGELEQPNDEDTIPVAEQTLPFIYEAPSPSSDYADGEILTPSLEDFSIAPSGIPIPEMPIDYD